MEWTGHCRRRARVTGRRATTSIIRRPGLAALDIGPSAKEMLRNFYQKGLGFLAKRPDEAALCVSDSRGSGRSGARGTDGWPLLGQHIEVARAQTQFI